MLRLTGHRGAVRALAHLPDGRLVSAGQDGRVLLHAPGGGPPALLHKLAHPVYAVAVRPDGGRLAFAGRPRPGDTANPVHQFDLDHMRLGVALSCTVEDRYFVTPPMNFPRLVTGPVARTVWSLGWSADGRLLAAAARRPGGGNIPEGGGGRWWDFATGQSHPLPADAYAVRFAPAGTRLAVARFRSLDWFDHPADPDPVWRLPHTVGYVADVAFAPAGDRFAAAAGAHLLIGGCEQKPARVKTGLRAVLGLAVSPDGGTLLAGGVPGGLEVYDLPAGTRRGGFDFGLTAVHAVAVAPDGLTAAAAGDGGLVRFDLDAG